MDNSVHNFTKFNVYNFQSFLIFSITGCPNVKVILKNDVLRKQGSLQGTYKLLGEVNGRDTWRKGTQAIWYYPEDKHWHIGPLEDIDTGKRGITSSGNQENTEIFNVPDYQWQYNTGSYFNNIKSGDISVKCVSKAYTPTGTKDLFQSSKIQD